MQRDRKKTHLFLERLQFLSLKERISPQSSLYMIFLLKVFSAFMTLEKIKTKN